jgi:gamma-glutamyltranspeptidase/glutathione hydrolase
MHGAIAAGSDATAEAGAAILRAGGNAVDAAVAASFAVAAGEPTLTSLAGAGVMLYRCGQTGEIVICDFFANAPGLGGVRPDPHDFYAVEVDFGPAVQEFYIGAGSAAVPGAIYGLCTVLDWWGSMPLDKVIEPACKLLREGVVLGPWQSFAVGLLEPILLVTEEGRRQFAPHGHLIREGERYLLPHLADTLEQLCAHGWREYYDQVIQERILRQFGPAAGGWISAEDLAAYRVEFRPPLAGEYRGRTIYSNPPPAAGGQMISRMLALMEGVEIGRHPHGSVEQLHPLCRAMQVADEARTDGENGLASERLGESIARFQELEGRPLGTGPIGDKGPGSTTHVSVIDEEGNAASITFSYGEGNGVLIEGTGIMMNNLLGEGDLFPEGFHTWPPGTRLATMMSPTLMVSRAGDVTVMGTGGSNRIRTALTQVISNLVDHRMPVEQAVRAPRVHFDAGVLNAEIFDREEGGEALQRLGAPRVITFDEPNLFFGGVHMVRRKADGTLEGAGDLRRGGTCRVV